MRFGALLQPPFLPVIFGLVVMKSFANRFPAKIIPNFLSGCKGRGLNTLKSPWRCWQLENRAEELLREIIALVRGCGEFLRSKGLSLAADAFDWAWDVGLRSLVVYGRRMGVIGREIEEVQPAAIDSAEDFRRAVERIIELGRQFINASTEAGPEGLIYSSSSEKSFITSAMKAVSAGWNLYRMATDVRPALLDYFKARAYFTLRGEERVAEVTADEVSLSRLWSLWLSIRRLGEKFIDAIEKDEITTQAGDFFVESGTLRKFPPQYYALVYNVEGGLDQWRPQLTYPFVLLRDAAVSLLRYPDLSEKLGNLEIFYQGQIADMLRELDAMLYRMVGYITNSPSSVEIEVEGQQLDLPTVASAIRENEGLLEWQSHPYLKFDFFYARIALKDFPEKSVYVIGLRPEDEDLRAYLSVQSDFAVGDTSCYIIAGAFSEGVERIHRHIRQILLDYYQRKVVEWVQQFNQRDATASEKMKALDELLNQFPFRDKDSIALSLSELADYIGKYKSDEQEALIRFFSRFVGLNVRAGRALHGMDVAAKLQEWLDLVKLMLERYGAYNSWRDMDREEREQFARDVVQLISETERLLSLFHASGGMLALFLKQGSFEELVDLILRHEGVRGIIPAWTRPIREGDKLLLKYLLWRKILTLNEI